jgi:hypothetical protein
VNPEIRTAKQGVRSTGVSGDFHLDIDDTRDKLDAYRNSGTLGPGGLTELE